MVANIVKKKTTDRRDVLYEMMTGKCCHNFMKNNTTFCSNVRCGFTTVSKIKTKEKGGFYASKATFPQTALSFKKTRVNKVFQRK